MEIALYFLGIAVCVAFLAWFFGRLIKTKKKRDALYESAEKKDCRDWTKEEREEELRRLNMMHQTGALTYSEYTVLKAKYEGKELSRADKDLVLMMREHEMMGKR